MVKKSNGNVVHRGPINSLGPDGSFANETGQRSNTRDDEEPHSLLTQTEILNACDSVSYRSCSVSVLLVMIVALALLTWLRYPLKSGVTGTLELGICAAVVSFMAFGSNYLPDSQLVRPHPVFWRLVLASAVLYLVALSFLLPQNLESLRKMFLAYDPSLTRLPEERGYAEDCRISTSEDMFYFMRTTFDVFIFAHISGYFVKTIIVRDWRLVTCMSISFEIVEVSLQHLLPNFKECWWDHILLDIVVCNGAGTLLGVLVLRMFSAREYDWMKCRNVKGRYAYPMKFILHFLPRCFVEYEWNVFLNRKRFLQCCMLLSLFTLNELNTFTLKHMLRIPSKHFLVFGRLVLWGLLAIPAVCEYYIYISGHDSKKKLGPFAWVSLADLFLEVVLVVKLATEGGYFTEPAPLHIALPLRASFLFFIIWFSLYFSALTLRKRQEKKCAMYIISNVFFYSGCACVLGMFAMGLPDLQIFRTTFESFVNSHEHLFSLLLW
uniref:Putative phosphatidylserine synthase n=1 Tax=Trypanosoma congolense (strain IL3000) TaxID=1068625 RepID=G0UQ27_TRYCI|nr:putative phosphatidylserine synthase [Trypanosoma congolense IL3000]